MKYSQNAVPNKPKETGKVEMQTNKEPDMGLSENSVPINQWLMIIIPFLNGYFIGNIPYFQTNPHFSKRIEITWCVLEVFILESHRGRGYSKKHGLFLWGKRCLLVKPLDHHLCLDLLS